MCVTDLNGMSRTSKESQGLRLPSSTGTTPFVVTSPSEPSLTLERSCIRYPVGNLIFISGTRPRDVQVIVKT